MKGVVPVLNSVASEVDYGRCRQLTNDGFDVCWYAIDTERGETTIGDTRFDILQLLLCVEQVTSRDDSKHFEFRVIRGGMLGG